MKLALSLLLVTLALCCSDANAEVCPVIEKEANKFIMNRNLGFLGTLLKLNAPRSFYQAVLDVKHCTNSISYSGRKKINNVVEAIVDKCNE
ncbi:PREDICTED: secretoglobin family 1D member 2-like [Myotis davidii]|uniref:secretoglobin family 1D member 2-like n=1 Tax=Myotis davidii TaxID=225400 RepID=UPI0007677487|nr:PREDICTED: secretoglobin family 1D member 2-like [Myotis davidii]